MKKALLIVVLLTSVLTTSFGQIVTNGLVSYFPFTLGSKTDSITGLTLMGNIPYPTTDRFGTDSAAFYFKSINSAFFDAGDNYDPLIIGNSALFTISFWMWMEYDSITGVLLAKYGNTQCGQDHREFFITMQPNNKLRLRFYGTLNNSTNHQVEFNDTSRLFQDSTWYHIVFAYDLANSDFKLFVNCLQDSIVKTTLGLGLTNGMQNGAAHVGIGGALSTTGSLCSPNSQLFTGKIDDIRIYNRILNQLEIDSLGCSSINVRVRENKLSDRIKMYPNPSNGIVTIDIESILNNNPILTIRNILGQKLQEFKILSRKTEVNFDEPNGIYFVTISTVKENYTTKIILQR